MRSRNVAFALTAGLFAVTVATTGAEASEAPEGGTQVHVVNSYGAPVTVYVEDAESRLHYLGRVLSASAKGMSVGEDVASKGKFRIKVYPESAPWDGLGAESGIRSGDVTLHEGEMVFFFVERELSDSGILVTSG